MSNDAHMKMLDLADEIANWKPSKREAKPAPTTAHLRYEGDDDNPTLMVPLKGASVVMQGRAVIVSLADGDTLRFVGGTSSQASVVFDAVSAGILLERPKVTLRAAEGVRVEFPDEVSDEQ